MLDTNSLFDVIAADDADRRTASRRALALAHTRVETNLGRFLRAATSEEEFEARLALVQDDFVTAVNSASEEIGHDHPEYIAKSLRDHYAGFAQPKPKTAGATDLRQWTPITAADAVNPSEQDDDSSREVSCPQCGGDGKTASGGKCSKCKGKGKVPNFGDSMLDALGKESTVPGDPWAAATQAYRAGEGPHPAVALPHLPQAQAYMESLPPEQQSNFMGTPGNFHNYGDPQRDVGVQAMVKEAPGKEHMPGVSDKRNRQYEHIKEQLEDSGKDEDRAKEEAARTVNKQRAEKGETKKADADVTGLGEPKIKLDKRKWNPHAAPDPDPSSERWPTEKKDIIEPIKDTNRDQDGHDLSEIGEKTTETVDLPAAGETEHGFYDGGQEHGPNTDTWHGDGGQADPVTKPALV